MIQQYFFFTLSYVYDIISVEKIDTCNHISQSIGINNNICTRLLSH